MEISILDIFQNKSLLSKSVIKQAWGKDALEFNPDRFDQENRHAYQEIVLIVEDFVTDYNYEIIREQE